MIDAILYGNGFNQLNNRLSLEELLDIATTTSKIHVDVPPTIKYEIGVIYIIKNSCM